MPAYMIFIRDDAVRDPAAMARYQELVAKSIPVNGLRPLAVYGATEGVEGAAPDGVVLLEFPDVAAAKAWYESPAYQTALPHRLQAADYRAFIFQGL